MTDKQLSISELVNRTLLLNDSMETSTLLGVGPMSHNCVQASLEVAKENDCPIMLIASRNQIDLDELGGGYANSWDQERFSYDVAEIAKAINFDGLYYLCRDHGGPWQRDKERNSKISRSDAMQIAKRSFTADIEAGFDLIMVDPTKSPDLVNGVVPIEDVIAMTVELIAYCESERARLNSKPLAYEVGTEETSGGLTTASAFSDFIESLSKELRARKLPLPSFIVGQTGTLVRKTHNAGRFDTKIAAELTSIARKANLGFKEHNADYLDSSSLLQHRSAGVTASNVAPEFGTAETLALFVLGDTEERLLRDGFIEESSQVKTVITQRAIETERWRKWMTGNQIHTEIAEVANNAVLTEEIVKIAGHYTLNQKDVRDEISKLSMNLSKASIDGKRFVIDSIKRPMQHYIDCFNLRGLTSRISSLGV